MEVDKDNFKEQLLPILNHIANASYVSLDLEMSGISTRPRYSPGDRSHEIGKPSLQQQYDEIRAAAETFQVLQVGITCVEEDREREFYLARPFNFPLSPLSAGGVDIKLERTFSFSSSACDFLKGNGFDFGKVFAAGVPYLSRHEEHDIREEFRLRSERNAKIPDVIVPLDDPNTLEFFRSARKRIADWVKDPKPEHPWVNIIREDGALNGYQRRLIYQLVRSEFPGYRVFGRNNGDFMQVEKLDTKKEAEFQMRALDRFNSQISKQKGLRWILEALSGGTLEGINPTWFCDPSNENPDAELLLRKRELADLSKKLKSKQQIIVGHNLLTDLAFIMNTFIGRLPRTVKKFQEDVHEMFPFVIDTKFLATHDDGKMHLRTNLKDLLIPFKKIHAPLILLHEEHTNYGSPLGKDHEAGFDSWMTAELFIKLSVKLYNERKHLFSHEHRESDSEKNATSVTKERTSQSDDETSQSSSGSSGGGVRLTPSIPSSPSHPTVRSNHPPEYYARKLNLDTHGTPADEVTQWMPEIGSSFWKDYANKLRVNASDEGICDLAEGDAEFWRTRSSQ